MNLMITWQRAINIICWFYKPTEKQKDGKGKDYGLMCTITNKQKKGTSASNSRSAAPPATNRKPRLNELNCDSILSFKYQDK